MALIDIFLARRIKRGRLTVHHADGKSSSFGAADPAFNAATSPSIRGWAGRKPIWTGAW